MRRIAFLFLIAAHVGLLAIAAGCGDDDGGGGDSDSDVDTDSDSDTDTDTDTGEIVCDLGTYEGDIQVHNLDELASLAGYTSISGYLQVLACAECTDLDDLVCLTSIDGILNISLNETLTNTDGLSGLASGVLNVTIAANDTLTSVDLSSLETVGGYLRIGGLDLPNPVLTSVDLSALTAVEGVVNIEYNAITDLDGLGALTSMGPNLAITENNSLPDCEVCDLLSQLTTAPELINVQNNLDDACTPVPDNCP